MNREKQEGMKSSLEKTFQSLRVTLPAHVRTTAALQVECGHLQHQVRPLNHDFQHLGVVKLLQPSDVFESEDAHEPHQLYKN